MHRLVGHAFIENTDPSEKYQIDHINKDNIDLCKEIISRLAWKRAAPHMVDFRPSNLRWCSNSENQKYKMNHYDNNIFHFLSNLEINYACIDQHVDAKFKTYEEAYSYAEYFKASPPL